MRPLSLRASSAAATSLLKPSACRLTIGAETSENVLRLYYESGEIVHDPDAAIQIIHQYYTDGRLSGEQKSSLDSAEAGQQIYIDNSNMPAGQVIRSAPIYGRRGYDFDGSSIRVERTPFSYEVIFHGNGFVADPASISVNYKSNFTIPAGWHSQLDLDDGGRQKTGC